MTGITVELDAVGATAKEGEVAETPVVTQPPMAKKAKGTKRKMDKRDACTAHPRCAACHDAQEQRRMLPEDLLIERQLVHANVLEGWRAAAVPNLYLNSRAEAVPVSGL